MNGELIKQNKVLVERFDLQWNFIFDRYGRNNTQIRMRVDKTANPKKHIYEFSEIYVKTKERETNEMTLDALTARLATLIVEDPTSEKSWDIARENAYQVLRYIENSLHEMFGGSMEINLTGQLNVG